MNVRKQKFDPKQYLGKTRIYRSVPSHRGISKILIWNGDRRLYDLPPMGSLYRATRYEVDQNQRRKRVFQYFEELDDALNWQAGVDPVAKFKTEQLEVELEQGLTFSNVVEEWRRKKLPQKARSTQVAYEKMLRLYFRSLMSQPMNGFTSKTVDGWLEELKKPTGEFMRSKRRIAFDHELSLLSGILRFYREYMDESFRHPVLERHQEDVQTGRTKIRTRKDIRPADFQKFLAELRKQCHGEMLSALAILQYYQALRISEAAAIHWEDIYLDSQVPEASRLRISRSIVWLRSKGLGSFINHSGFKNSEANDGCKEQPLFPESYFALVTLNPVGKTGLVFQEGGEHFGYRQIEFAYNKAFVLAGLPYRGTHIMRHGGTRLVYNATKDLEVAKQILGNRDIQTVQVYAQRDASALTQFARERWKQAENVIAMPQLFHQGDRN